MIAQLIDKWSEVSNFNVHFYIGVERNVGFKCVLVYVMRLVHLQEIAMFSDSSFILTCHELYNK